MFGACGFDSNHYADDNVQSDDERVKCFGVSASNFDRSFVDIISELCKTRLECWKCHNRYGPNMYDVLPSECYGDYDFPSRPFSAAQDSDEGNQLYCCLMGS